MSLHFVVFSFFLRVEELTVRCSIWPRLKELEAREETLKLVAGLVGLDKVRSQLRMISLRREFLQERNKALAAARGTSIFSFLSLTRPALTFF